MRTALITGSSGFTGRHLSQRLRARGDFCILGAGRHQTTDSVIDTFHVVDLTSAAQVEELITRTRPDIVFHLAGASTGSAEDLHRINATATALLLDALCRHIPAARTVVVGSAAEYGPPRQGSQPMVESDPCFPQSAYGRSKLAATRSALRAADAGLNVVVARPFNIVGRGMPSTLVLGAVLERARAALRDNIDHIAVGRLDTARDFIAVEDVAEAYIRLADADAAGQVVNICSGVPHTIESMVLMLLSHAPRPIRLVTDPALVRDDDVPVAFGSNALARRLIDFVPSTPLELSLEQAWLA